jgi:hypothetical protein
VTLGVLLLIPLVYLVLTLGRLQAASFAVDGAAREAARAFTTAGDDASGRARALAAVRLGLLDQGFRIDPATATRLTCSATPCLTPRARLEVEVAVPVVLPGIPGFVDRFAATHLTVRSVQGATVDAFVPSVNGAGADGAGAARAGAAGAGDAGANAGGADADGAAG